MAEQIVGIGIGRGAAVGRVARARPPVEAEATTGAAEPSVAADRLIAVFGQVADELEEQALRAGDGPLGEVLRATAAMARDPELARASASRVLSGTDPVLAVDAVVDEHCQLFAALGGYLAERATDLRSVRDRVLARLLGAPSPGVPPLAGPSIIVARDLAPADLVGLDLDKVLAIVVEEGGPTSHTAIVAGQIGLPCVVRATGAASLLDGEVVAVDAATGTVTVDPDERTIRLVADRQAALAALGADTSDGATADGRRVQLLANIGTLQDAERLDAGVEGVGLFRTEVLFLGSASAPTADKQVVAYTRALTALGGRKVVIRTLDAGADKPLAFVTQPGEENPALGVRGYRLVRRAPDVLTTQLEAIARAGRQCGVDPWTMAPMIATATEARAFAEAARAAGLGTVGVMIEIPAAALCAREILAEVDFVSLGTNDLAQYTMAADRLRGELADLLDPWQPAVLRMVAAAAAAGVELGKPVGVCGESAADPLMALVLAGLGVTSLSMAPAAIPAVRHSLAHHTLTRCQAMAERALGAPSADVARGAVIALLDPAVRDIVLVPGEAVASGTGRASSVGSASGTCPADDPGPSSQGLPVRPLSFVQI